MQYQQTEMNLCLCWMIGSLLLSVFLTTSTAAAQCADLDVNFACKLVNRGQR